VTEDEEAGQDTDHGHHQEWVRPDEHFVNYR
jgi:hypothetical protein